MSTSTVTIKGQITIPIKVRRKLGVKPSDKVVFVEKKGEIALEKLSDLDSLYGSLKNPKVKPLSNKQMQTLIQKGLFKNESIS